VKKKRERKSSRGAATQVPGWSAVRTPTKKPKVFVASSSESLPLGKLVKNLLSQSCLVGLWTEVFEPSHMLLPSIVDLVREYDFGVFVFAPDDISTSRGESESAVRDNVLLELGIFMGALGFQRTFVLVEQGGSLRIPADLQGLLTSTIRVDSMHDSQAVSNNEAEAAIRRIEQTILRQGPAPRNVYNELHRLQQFISEFEFTVDDGDEIYSLENLLALAVSQRDALWYELTHPLRVMKPILDATSDDVADYVYWQLVVLGVFEFKSSENFTNETDWTWRSSIEYVQLSSRGAALLNVLRSDRR
jgi:predicted nucleotide-binding protein